jgi:hypothetical protein
MVNSFWFIIILQVLHCCIIVPGCFNLHLVIKLSVFLVSYLIYYFANLAAVITTFQLILVSNGLQFHTWTLFCLTCNFF